MRNNRLLKEYLFSVNCLSSSLYACKSQPPWYKKGVDLNLWGDCIDSKIVVVWWFKTNWKLNSKKAAPLPLPSLVREGQR